MVVPSAAHCNLAASENQLYQCRRVSDAAERTAAIAAMLPGSIRVPVSCLQPTYLLSIVPAMPLAPCMAAPRIEGIVHHQAMLQHLWSSVKLCDKPNEI